MLFPSEKMQIVMNYQGKESEDGWLVLDFSRMDTDGLGKVYIDLADLDSLRENKKLQTDAFKRAKDLLSLEDED